MEPYAKIIIFVIGYALRSVAFYFLFDKAEEKSYKALIPFVRYHTLFKICWHTAYFYPYIVLSLISRVLNYYVNILIEGDYSLALVVFSLVYLAVTIVLLILSIKLSIRMGRAFSRSNRFIIGLVLLPTVFLYILTFSKKSKYIGAQE